MRISTPLDGPPPMPFGADEASGYGREMGNAGVGEPTIVKSVFAHPGKRPPLFSAGK